MSYRIPLFELNFGVAEEAAVLACLRSKWISTGPRTIEFERRFSEMLNGGHSVALANCTVALHLALLLAGVGEGDEVICPSLTFVATVNAIRYVGAVPVFADIKGIDDLTIDPAEIARKITARTKAVMVMHYGGFPCDMDQIMSIADKNQLKVIEDACHAPFSDYNGVKLGTIGDYGCFSFFSNKNISTGEGGMLVTKHPECASRAKLLRSHGMTTMSYQRAEGHATTYDVTEPGYNYRMDDLRASLGLAQLDRVLPDLAARAKIRERYLQRLSGSKGVTVPFASHKQFTSNYIFTVAFPNTDSSRRDEIRALMAEAGIQTSMHYPPVHQFSFYKEFDCELPVTDLVSAGLITLPMYSSLGISEVDFIAETLLEIIDE